MPELPEVETIRGQLSPLVEGRTLRRMEILDARWSRPLAPEELASALEGRRVERLARRGKYLLWSFDGDVHLAQHLRMTGALLVEPAGGRWRSDPPHTRVRLELGPQRGHRARSRDGGRPAGRASSGASKAGGRHGSLRLAIVDSRRFGTGELLLGSAAVEAFFAARLGLEPLDERFTADELRRLARGRRTPIKSFLLDQRLIAGVGNIYADEALFRARIHPLRPAGRLSRGQYAALREGLIEALQAGIDARGATIDDFRDVDGVSGSFQDQFLVHRRAGEPCPGCGGEIVKMVVGGRGTYVCETCQPRPRSRARRRARRSDAGGSRQMH
jgi:formamidopyrimidine-DNA glycosylase